MRPEASFVTATKTCRRVLVNGSRGDESSETYGRVRLADHIALLALPLELVPASGSATKRQGE
jgi:hypothetical protein